MSGPTGNLMEGWKLLTDPVERDNGYYEAENDEEYEGIQLEDPTWVGCGANGEPSPTSYLGCNHHVGEYTNDKGVNIRYMKYEMKEFLQSSLDLYKQLACACGYMSAEHLHNKLTPSKTPFEKENHNENALNCRFVVLAQDSGSQCFTYFSCDKNPKSEPKSTSITM